MSKASIPYVPTLLVQGRKDSMMPTRSMRAFAERMGRLATYVEVDSGHFAFLDRHAECERAIATWLRQRNLSTRVRQRVREITAQPPVRWPAVRGR